MTARLTVVGVAALALFTRSALPDRAAPVESGAAPVTAAGPGGAPPPGTVPTSSTTSPRALPVPPRARPLVLPAGRSAPAFDRLPVSDRVIFLGVDDGLVRDPAVLDRIERERIPVSAFLTGGAAEADPAFWRRAVAAGVRIQAHTITHPDLTRVSGATLRREVCGTIESFTALAGRRPTLFRPPYGKMTDAVRRQAAECGYKAVILWTGSTNNGRLTMQAGPLQAGDIILLHWRDTLAADLDDVIARCRQEGFTIAALEDYML